MSSTDPAQSPAAADPLDPESALQQKPAPKRPGNADDAPFLPSGLDDEDHSD